MDPEAGEWELLYLVQRPNAQAQAQARDGDGNGAGNGEEGAVVLAGYLTIYAFNNPLKGKGLRVCQALVLPSFQRQGAWCSFVCVCVCIINPHGTHEPQLPTDIPHTLNPSTTSQQTPHTHIPKNRPRPAPPPRGLHPGAHAGHRV